MLFLRLGRAAAIGNDDVHFETDEVGNKFRISSGGPAFGITIFDDNVPPLHII